MRILFLSRYQRELNRGAESFVAELSKRLSDYHQVEVYSGRDSDNINKIIKGDFNVVIPVNGRMQSLKVSLGRGMGHYKILITGHSGRGWDDIWNITITRPNLFVALTEYLANWAKKWAFGVKIIKISNGVDIQKFNPAASKLNLGLKSPIVLSVGALTWYKHHERVIQAVSKLEKISLLIVGEGTEKIKLQKLGEKLLSDRFKIASFDYEQMPSVYRGSNLFTLPSWDREAFGLVYLEALASGLPVVAPNDLSRKEIVGDGGLLVNASDINAYAKAIDQALKTKWGDKPRKQAEKFSWEEVANLYEKAINSLFKNPV